MITSESEITWNEQKIKLKQKFGVITDNDFLFVPGKKEEMIGRLQIKLGKPKKRLEKSRENIITAITGTEKIVMTMTIITGTPTVIVRNINR